MVTLRQEDKSMKKLKFLLIPIFCLLLGACIVGCSDGKDYTVIFNSVGGTSVSKVYVKDGNNIEFPQDPTKTGYTFGGWYKENLTDKIDAEYFVTQKKDKVIYAYAKWVPNAYDITFEYGEATGGNATSKSTVNYGETYSLPTPTKIGFTFGGWYTKANGLGDLIVSTTKVKTASDHTLYAYWVKNTQVISVSSNYNNTNTNTYTYADIESGYGFEVTICGRTIAFVATPETISYNETILERNDNGYYDCEGDVYCKYTNGALKFYNYNGIGYEETIVDGAELSLFDYSAEALTTSDETVEITKANDVYHVEIEDVGFGDLKIAFKNYTTETLQEETPVEIKYWAELHTVVFAETIVVDGVEYSYSAVEDTLYSTVSSTNVALRVKFGDVINTLPTMQDTEWLTFDGWYSLGANGKKYENGKSVLDVQDTLYLEARFVPKQCKLEFITNKNSTNVIGSSLSRILATKYYNVGSVVDVDALPIPSISGFIFEGWSSSEDEAVEVSNDFVLCEDAKLYAMWTAKAEDNAYGLYLNTLDSDGNYISYNQLGGSSVFINLTSVEENVYSFSYNGKNYVYNSQAKTLKQDAGTAIESSNTRQEVFAFDDVTFVCIGSQMVVCPTKEGFTFKYWVNNPYSITAAAYNFASAIIKDRILYASFDPIKVEVVYKTAENSTETPYGTLSIAYNKSIVSSSLPTITPPEGKKLFCWYYINGANQKVDVFGETVSEVLNELGNVSSISLYPKWIADTTTLKITYKANGTVANTQVVKYGENLDVLPTNKLAGYYFLGWFYNNGNEEYRLQDTDVWSSDSYWMDGVTYNEEDNQYSLTVEAKYLIRLFAVVIRYNNGQLLGFEWLPNAVPAGEKVELPGVDYFNVEHEGYDLVGYNTQADGKGTSYAPGDELTVDMTTSLYLIWKPKTSAIVYLSSSGQQLVGMPDKVVNFGDEIGYFEYIDDKDNGYAQGFAGWKIIEEGTTADVQIIITEGHKFKTYQPNYLLYASWDDAYYYVRYMSYELFDEEEHMVCLGSNYTSKHLIGTQDTLQKTSRIPTRDGYVFDGWVDEDGNDFVFGVNVDKDMYIFASWKQVNEVHLSYGYETTAVLEDIDLIEGSMVGDLPFLTRTNYTFDGWYTEVNGGGMKITADTIWNGNSSILYANWKLVDGTTTFYKVRIVVDGVISSGSYVSATVVEPEAPIKTGYRFIGWYTSAQGGSLYDFDNTMINSDITLYARFI